MTNRDAVRVLSNLRIAQDAVNTICEELEHVTSIEEKDALESIAQQLCNLIKGRL